MLSLIGKLGSALARKGVIRGTAGRMLGGADLLIPSRMGSGTLNTAAARGMPTGPGWGGPLEGAVMPSFRPGVGIVTRAGGALVRGGGAAVAARGAAGIGRRYSKKVAGMLAAGILFEAGGKLFNAITGKEHKESRRMNYANGKALKRAIRRFDGAAKQYAKVLKATSGTKKCGYTIKAKRPAKRCA